MERTMSLRIFYLVIIVITGTRVLTGTRVTTILTSTWVPACIRVGNEFLISHY
jgi:hypothetical protein